MIKTNEKGFLEAIQIEFNKLEKRIEALEQSVHYHAKEASEPEKPRECKHEFTSGGTGYYEYCIKCGYAIFKKPREVKESIKDNLIDFWGRVKDSSNVNDACNIINEYEGRFRQLAIEKVTEKGFVSYLTIDIIKALEGL